MTSSYLTKPLRSEHEVRSEREILEVAVAWRKTIWRERGLDEDQKLDKLVDICRRLRDGDLAKGRTLATATIYSFMSTEE